MMEMILPATMIQFPSNLHLRILLQSSCSMGGHVHGEVAAQKQEPLVAAFLLDAYAAQASFGQKDFFPYSFVVIKYLRRCQEERSINQSFKMAQFPINIMMIILVYHINAWTYYCHTFVILIHANNLFVSGMDLAATYSLIQICCVQKYKLASFLICACDNYFVL
jgi:hypothetical protein